MVFAVIRVRGTVNIRDDIRQTLKLLRLHRVNHCVLLPDNQYSRGMLQKVKDYVTWGEIKPQVLNRLIQKRGLILGNKPLVAAELEARTGYKSFAELTNAIASNRVQLKDMKEVKPLFRLHPPRRGWGGIKRSFVNGGALGDRGVAINNLLLRML